MSELDEQESEFLRLLRQVPFDDAPRAEHRDALREQASAVFDAAVDAAVFDSAVFDSAVVSGKRRWWKRAGTKGGEIMKRPVPRLIVVAAACLAVAGVWLFVPGRQTTAQAFNKLAETLITARTARFQMQVKIEKVDLNVRGRK